MADGKKLRVVMIGAGGRSNSVIYPSVAGLPDVEMAAICDIDAERCDETADRYGVAKRYIGSVYEYQRMVREISPDAVFAIGDPDVFYPIWQWCLENGQNLYVEKPMGLTIHQARSLAYLAEKHGSITQVSFQRRHTPMVEQLRDECLKRGPITHAVCRFYKYLLDPVAGPRDHMMDDCVHSIDTLRWMCGGEVVKVESHTRRVQVPDINFISATLHFDNGAVGYLINSWASGKRIFSVEMHAPGVFAEAEHETRGRLYADGDVEGVPYDAATCAGSDEFHVLTGVQGIVSDFLACVRDGRRNPNGFADSVKTMEVAEVILAQALLAGR